MPIPESQLGRWSNHGAQDASIRTHEAIRRVIYAYRWPQGVKFDFYLQGSYKNDTNIRGDSDVDVVLELNSTFEHDASNLSQYDRSALEASFQPATYRWNDFRRDALKALEAGFGGEMVGQGNKSIKLKPSQTRLAADVVVCMTHRRYNNLRTFVEGITFWALHDKRWIINFPNEHYKNGASKSRRTYDRFKRTVRMFKNARNHLESSGRISADLAPSYFVECLLYNAPDLAFNHRLDETYCSIVNWIGANRLDNLVCQNEQQYLFGPTPEQWSVENAKTLGNELAWMWNSWR